MWAADTADRSLVVPTLAFAGFYVALALPTLWRQEAPVAWLLASVGLALALAALSAVDLRDYRLPDVLTLPLAATGVLASWWLGLASPWWAIGSAVIGFALLTVSPCSTAACAAGMAWASARQLSRHPVPRWA